VENTFINRTAVNSDLYRDKMSLVAGFPEGRILKVTYFSKNHAVTDIQSDVVDLSQRTKDDVHKTWTEIRNFELRINNELSFEYDQDNTSVRVASEGILPPRFVPKIGDIFLYELRNGKIGQFYVDNINRLALGQDTYHTITFSLQNYLDVTQRDDLEKNVTQVRYFDKVKYLVGDSSLLTSEGYIQQKDLRALRSEIIEDYFARFWDTTCGSFIRPDGLYDPYVVEYWNKKVGVEDLLEAERPTQLLISVSNYRRSIFGLLTVNPIKNLNQVDKIITTATYSNTFWATNITSLLGKTFIALGKEPTRFHGGLDNGVSEVFDMTSVYYAKMTRDVSDKRVDWFFIRSRQEFLDKYYPDTEFPKYLDGKHPIHSTEELMEIAKTIYGIGPDEHMDDARVQLVKGYAQWYHEAYPGTYADSDLKRIWLQDLGRDPEEELSEEDTEKLRSYITSYRSKYSAETTRDTVLDKNGKFGWIYYPLYHKRPRPAIIVPGESEDIDESLYYALSSAFYNGDYEHMSAFEKLIYDSIYNNELDIALLLDLIKEYGSWSDTEAFYKHMFALHLIDKALYWLNNH